MHIIDSDHWLKAGSLLNAHNEPALAQKVLLKSLEICPTKIEALEQLFLAFQKRGQSHEALKCAKALVRLEPSSKNYFRMGDCYYQLGEDEQALQAFRAILQSLEYDETLLFDVYKNIGNIFVKQGDFESAEEFYDKAFTLNNHSAVLLTNYGTLEIQRENLEAAKDRFVAAIEIDENFDKAWVGLGLVHFQFGDLEIAIGNLEKALDAQPKNKTALKLFVEWSTSRGEFSKPQERIEQYLMDVFDDEDVLLMHAQILWCKGLRAAAKLELEHALLLNPSHSMALSFEQFLRAHNA